MPIGQVFMQPPTFGNLEMGRVGQYVADPYSVSHYAQMQNYNMSPFEAMVRTSTGVYGAPPPGVDQYDYYTRMQTASERFNRFSNPFASGYGAASSTMSFGRGLANLAIVSPGIIGAVGGAFSERAGAVLGGAADSFYNYATGANFNALSNLGAGVGTELGGAFGGMMHRAADAFGMGKASTGAGQAVSGYLSTAANYFKDAKTGKFTAMGETFSWAGKLAKERGAFSSIAGMLGKGLGRGLTMFGGMALTNVLMSKAQDTFETALYKVSEEEEYTADTFERLGKNIFGTTSRAGHRKLGEEIAKGIRKSAATDVALSGGWMAGISNMFGGPDTFMGRMFSGGDVINKMKQKTAMFGLLGQSGMLGKASSGEDFIKKAEEFEKALQKVSKALGQTATQALETSKALYSQGLMDPRQIAQGAQATQLTSFMTGQSTNQVLAMSSVGTEAFRGTGFGSNMGFSMSQDIMRRTAIAEEEMGKKWDQVKYTMRGNEGAQAAMTKTMSYMSNMAFTSDMFVAAMFDDTKEGFVLRKDLDEDVLRRTMAGEQTRLTSEDRTAKAYYRFNNLNRDQQRKIRSKINAFKKNMTFSDMKGMVGSAAKAFGYDSFEDFFANKLVEQGIPADVAETMAKTMSMDVGAKTNLAGVEMQQRELIARKFRQAGQSSFAANIPLVGGVLSQVGAMTGVGGRGFDILSGAATGAAAGAGLGSFAGPAGTVIGGIGGALVGGGIAAYSTLARKQDSFWHQSAATVGTTTLALGAAAVAGKGATAIGGGLLSMGALPMLAAVGAGTQGERVFSSIAKMTWGEERAKRMLESEKEADVTAKALGSALTGGVLGTVAGGVGLYAMGALTIGTGGLAFGAAALAGGAYALYNHYAGRDEREARRAARRVDIAIGAASGMARFKKENSEYYSHLQGKYKNWRSFNRSEGGRFVGIDLKRLELPTQKKEEMASMARDVTLNIAQSGGVLGTAAAAEERQLTERGSLLRAVWRGGTQSLKNAWGLGSSGPTAAAEGVLAQNVDKWMVTAPEFEKQLAQMTDMEKLEQFQQHKRISMGSVGFSSMLNLSEMYKSAENEETKAAIIAAVGEKEITDAKGNVLWKSTKDFFEKVSSGEVGLVGKEAQAELGRLNKALGFLDENNFQLKQGGDAAGILSYIAAAREKDPKIRQRKLLQAKKTLGGSFGAVQAAIDKQFDMKTGKYTGPLEELRGYTIGDVEFSAYRLGAGAERDLQRSAIESFQDKLITGTPDEKLGDVADVINLMSAASEGKMADVKKMLASKDYEALGKSEDSRVSGFYKNLKSSVSKLDSVKGKTMAQIDEMFKGDKGPESAFIKAEITKAMGKDNKEKFTESDYEKVFTAIKDKEIAKAVSTGDMKGDPSEARSVEQVTADVLDKLAGTLKALDQTLLKINTRGAPVNEGK